MKEKINQYIEYLSFFHLDVDLEFWQPNFIACNTGSELSSVNRVYVPNNIHEFDNEKLKKYFDKNDFTFWINDSNELGNKTMIDMRSSIRFSYPLMLLNLTETISYKLHPLIQIKQIFHREEILTQWAPLVASAYEKIDVSAFQKFITYLLSTKKSEDIHFYIGYYAGQPCATSMLIIRDKISDIHWVGTIPQFRNKSLGLAVTLYPLVQLQNKLDKAILYASDMGKPIYQKIGFKEICKVNVYKPHG
jgi:hypothetical protein